MAHQATSVEEREGLVAGSAHQQGQLLLLHPQPAVLGVRQVSLGPLDPPGHNYNYNDDSYNSSINP